MTTGRINQVVSKGKPANRDNCQQDTYASTSQSTMLNRIAKSELTFDAREDNNYNRSRCYVNKVAITTNNALTADTQRKLLDVSFHANVLRIRLLRITNTNHYEDIQHNSQHWDSEIMFHFVRIQFKPNGRSISQTPAFIARTEEPFASDADGFTTNQYFYVQSPTFTQ